VKKLDNNYGLVKDFRKYLLLLELKWVILLYNNILNHIKLLKMNLLNLQFLFVIMLFLDLNLINCLIMIFRDLDYMFLLDILWVYKFLIINNDLWVNQVNS